MIIDNNPFVKLNIRPSDSIEKINDAAEAKSFMDDQNETEYELARVVLTSPNRRIEGEVSFIYSNCNEYDKSWLQELLCADDEELEMQFTDRERLIIYLDTMNNALQSDDNESQDIDFWAKYIIQIDRIYNRVFSVANLKKELRVLDKYRRNAQVPMVEDYKIYERYLRNFLDSEIIGISNKVISSLGIDNSVTLLNLIAEEKISPGIGDVKKKYGIVIERFLAAYSVLVQERLEDERYAIVKMIDKAYSYEDRRQLQPLFNKVKKFDHLAQPLQLYFQDIGNSEKQKESVVVASALRRLAIYYHTELEATDLSLDVTELGIALFPELPAIYEKLVNDATTFKKLLPKRRIQIGARKLFYKIDKIIVRDDDHANENRAFIDANKSEWIYVLKDLGMEAKFDYEYTALARCVHKIASACTWGDAWRISYEFMKLGEFWANHCDDQELLKTYIDDMNKWEES